MMAMRIVATTMIGYVACGVFLLWYIPFLTRNRSSAAWFPSRIIHFLFGDGLIAVSIALTIQVIVPAAFVAWASVATFKLFLPS